MTRSGDDPAPELVDAAERVFGDELPRALTYAALLGGDGVAHGHIGPREVPRLWSRHLFNSALLADLIAPSAVVVDVGSGAGLPGVPMALRRPDLRLVLLEPMQRRCLFLLRVIDELGLADRVSVHRGRVDEPATIAELGPQDWLVARAVAPLDRLVRWCVPLLRPRGRLLALKGESAANEVEQHRDTIGRLGGLSPTVVELGGQGTGDRTWVVSVQRRATRARKARSSG